MSIYKTNDRAKILIETARSLVAAIYTMVSASCRPDGHALFRMDVKTKSCSNDRLSVVGHHLQRIRQWANKMTRLTTSV